MTPNDADTPVISIHVLIGIGPHVRRTMELYVDINGARITTLLDSGSTHNFVDLDTTDRVGIKLGGFAGLHVTMANGECVQSPGCWKNLAISIGDEPFTLDFYGLASGRTKWCSTSSGWSRWGQFCGTSPSTPSSSSRMVTWMISSGATKGSSPRRWDCDQSGHTATRSTYFLGRRRWLCGPNATRTCRRRSWKSSPTELVGVLDASAAREEARWLVALLRRLQGLQQQHGEGEIPNSRRGGATR
jgi:hypothetical protein